MERILVGLGNPGLDYEKTRHNIGFDVINFLAEKYNFPPFSERYGALTSKGEINGHQLALMKPMTYMNNSGLPLQKFLQYFKVSTQKIIVFHDELELATARLKMKLGGGHAGHNGLRSIDQNLGHEYWRVRFGISRPQHAEQSVSSYVLQKFSNDELAKIDEAKQLIARRIDDIITLQCERFNSEAGQFFQGIKENGI